MGKYPVIKTSGERGDFPQPIPKASYFVSQLCGSFLHAWIEPWRLFLSSNVSGLLFGQNR